ncbi:MAG TPA: DUF2017 family protein [Actinomycetes bacterium]|nr:DUF2017 family protein [Actinomycetes bacterium]
MTSVWAVGDGRIVVDLRAERWWLRLYLVDLLELLGPEPEMPDDPLAALAATAAGDPERPTDPVLARLLPDGVVDDDAAATEFRRFTHESLLTQKRAGAKAVWALLDGSTGDLDRSQAGKVLGGVNDLRLMMGTRLMVTEDADDEASEQLTELAAYRSYLMLGWLQEQLLEALTSE